MSEKARHLQEAQLWAAWFAAERDAFFESGDPDEANYCRGWNDGHAAGQKRIADFLDARGEASVVGLVGRIEDERDAALASGTAVPSAFPAGSGRLRAAHALFFATSLGLVAVSAWMHWIPALAMSLFGVVMVAWADRHLTSSRGWR